MADPISQPWCELVEQCSASLRLTNAYALCSVLISLSGRVDELPQQKLCAIGTASRRLLEFAWQQEQRDSWLVTWALRLVCRTFESDHKSSAALLRQALTPEHMAEHAFEEMPWIAREVGPLAGLDPDLVEDIYRAVFSHKELSDAPTPMGSSKILVLTSNRRQDFQGTLYELGRTYPVFLRESPIHATRALILAMDAYVAQEHAPGEDSPVDELFDFDNLQAAIRTDYSSIWDSSTHVAHDALTLLNQFEAYLRALSSDAAQVQVRQQVLNTLVTSNRLAVLWRRLLFVGTTFPQTFGQEIRCLAWAKPILVSLDTSVPAGDFLRVKFAMLSDAEREHVERVILSIPAFVEEKVRAQAETVRDRLLGCLPSQSIVTEEAWNQLARLAQQGGPPRNESFFQIGPVVTEHYSDAEYLAHLGAPVDAGCNQRVLDLSKPIQRFAANYLSTSPSMEEAAATLPALLALHESLARSESDGVHSELASQAWGHLAEACERIAKVKSLSCTEGVGAFVKRTLLEAARHPAPLPDPEYDSQFDERLSMGGPSARTAAAGGLPLMARHRGCVDEPILAAIEDLSSDPVPAVRLQVASRLTSLYYTSPETMWRILGHVSSEETSRGVLSGLLGNSLRPLAGHHPQRVVELAEQIFNRITTGPGAKSVRTICVNIFSGLYLWQDNAKCREIVFRITDEPILFFDEAEQVLLELRGAMAARTVRPSAPGSDEARGRAVTLMLGLLESIRNGIKELETVFREIPLAIMPAAKKDEAQNLVRLTDSACDQVYFASGAFDQESGENKERGQLDAEEKQRFFTELMPVLKALAGFGFAPVVHNLLKTLEFLLDVDPREVFLLIADAVRAGRSGGYQQEQMGTELIVCLVERYMAEYRHILRADRDCREALREILDTFVQWPNARRLTYRLDEIFR